MINIISKKYQLFLILIFLLSFTKIFQGIDFTDEGFILSSYKFVFSNYHNLTHYDFKYLGSFIFGGFFYYFFHFDNIIHYRILYFFLSFFTILIIYLILKKKIEFSKNELLVILFLIFLFNTSKDSIIISYDNISLFFVSIYIFFLSKDYKKKIDYFFLGLFNVLIIFICIKNIPICLLSSILIFKFFDNQNSVFERLFLFFLGNIFAILLISILLYKIGYLNEYLNSFIEIYFEIFETDRQSHYRASYLIVRLARDIFIVLAFLVIFLVFNIFIKKNNFFSKKILFVIFSTILFLLEILVLDFSRWYLPAILIYGILIHIIEQKKSRLFFSIIISSGFLFILGSAAGIDKISYFFYFYVPIFLHFIKKLRPIANLNLLSIERKKTYFDFSIIFLIIFSLFGNLFDTYRDSYSKTNLVYKINTDKTKYVFTTEVRAKEINSLFNFLKSLDKTNEKTLIIGSTPMIFFLFDIKPFLYTWPEILSEFEINEKLKDENYVPENIIFTKVDTMRKSWPLNADLKNQKTQSYDKRRKKLSKFFDKASYEVVWSNNTFIYYKLKK